ncbi:amidase/aspartyl-tRNA(Asn)/glutamyl-tRNA(Gln) amidotransferase subunit A [Sinobaca qinghaiensis]|uniref:Amidase/aspartyl-tRNA(Asn)/glutamyl-tRNA(Gln) amidotransferase subunit A n=1 Tax=Sinobaca qinghaiensis TaxID=342944 RepID=A0A419V044_9BACL|nr:amidase [Sinobaca qinghaiensis]RKD71303.1 amidase/aspartyl-tRNA(Asn)/glutamyl-tRNA(Gln) amidotransferase subunit A [Sinobaca qinghaiensis]
MKKPVNVFAKKASLTALATAFGASIAFSPLSSVSAEESFPFEEITANELKQGFESGEYSSKEVVQSYLDRIATYEETYNAFTFMNPNALEEAEEIDNMRENGEPLGELAGVPIVIKEAVDVEGFPTTFGWAPLSEEAGGIELAPTSDAPVVEDLKEAGAIIIGKTNIPAFSASGTNASTSWAGDTYNVVDPRLAPGGSSSGTAASVSGNFAMMGIAEETGGSIQNPAAAQALASVKPTFGLVPTTGVTPLAGGTRDVLGPHARTVEDAALMLDVIAGEDEGDPKTEAAAGNVPEDGYTASLDDEALEGKRIGLYGAEWREDGELSAETQELYDRSIAELEAQGAEVISDPFEGSGLAAFTEEAGNVGYDAFVYDLNNYLQDLDPGNESLNVNDVFEEAGEVPWTEEGPLRFLVERGVDFEGTLEDPETMPDQSEFEEAKAEYLQIIDNVMEEQDLDGFVYPQMAEEIPPLADQEANIEATTVPEINISGLPLVTVPAGYYESGSPFSLAFFGEEWSEADLIGMAYDYEQATDYRETPELDVQEGGALPETASHYAVWMMSGFAAAGLGGILWMRNRRRHTNA